MKTRSFVLILFAAVLLLFAGTFNFAQAYDMAEAEVELATMAEQLSSIFGPNLGGMSYIGDPIGYYIIPRWEVGLAGGVVVVPVQDISEGTKMSLNFGGMNYFPIPAAGAHGRFTIKRFEFGLKVAGIPQVENKDAGAKIANIIIGGRVRYKIFDFSRSGIKGGASAGGFYEYMRGSLELTDSDNMPIDVNDDGVTDGYMISDTTFDTNWRAHTMGGEVQANIHLWLLNFFLGSRVGKSLGSAETVVEGLSEIIDTVPPSVLVTPGSKFISISKVKNPAAIDVFVFGGVEFNIFMLTITGKAGYNITNENYTIDGGVRLQF